MAKIVGAPSAWHRLAIANANNEQDTAQAFTSDGWFRSGDLGYVHEQGYLYNVGRKKDTIVLPSGKNVFPEDVESHYQRSPLISEICVIGRGNTTGLEGAERLCAVVVPTFDYLRESHIGNAGESIRWGVGKPLLISRRTAKGIEFSTPAHGSLFPTRLRAP